MKKNTVKVEICALFVLLLLATGCYERKEGCLDLNATNYDVGADDPCDDDCCTYPTLSLSLLHRFALADIPDSLVTFNLNRLWALADAPENLFRITKAQLYLSQIEFLYQDEVFVVSDTISLWLPEGGGFRQTLATDDFVRIEPANANFLVGNFNYVGPVDLIRFTIGLQAPVSQLDQTRIPNNHPLAITADSLNYDPDRGLFSAQVALLRDTLPGADSISVRAFEPVTLGVPVDFTIEPGFNIVLQFRLRYHELFEGIDIRNTDLQNFEVLFQQNLSKLVELVEIRQE